MVKGKPILEPLNRALNASSERLAIAAGWGLLGLSVLIAVEVVGRKFFAFSTQGADETGGYVLAITTSAGFSYALYRKAHVRIEVLLAHFPYSLQGMSTILTYALINMYAWFLAWRATAVLGESFILQSKAPTPLETPLIYPQGLWTAALIFFAVFAAFQLLQAVELAVRRQWSELASKFGIRSIEEEVRDEMTETRARVSGSGERN